MRRHMSRFVLVVVAAIARGLAVNAGSPARC
jgi:hypothetical protein